MPTQPTEQERTAYEELLAYFPDAEQLDAPPAEEPDTEPTAPEDAEAPAAESAEGDVIEETPAADTAPAEPSELDKLKAQVEALQAKLAETSQAEPAAEELAVSVDDPLPHIEDERQLHAEIERARRITKWATANWDGIGPDGEPTSITNDKGEKVELTAAQIREYYSKYRDILDYAPNKAQQLRATQELSAEAERVYPELANPKSKEAIMAAQLLQALPGIKKFPDWKLFVGDWVRGQKMRFEAQQAKAQPSAVKPELAPKAPMVKAAKVPVAAKDKAVEEVWNSAGSKDALENYFLKATQQ